MGASVAFVPGSQWLPQAGQTTVWSGRGSRVARARPVPRPVVSDSGTDGALGGARDGDESWRADALLAARVQEGDVSAFGQLVERYMRRAYSVAYRLLGQREDAEDLVQEAFLTALDRIAQYDPGRPFGGWFFRIVVTRGLNMRKARSVRATEPLADDLAATASSPERNAMASEVRDRVLMALQSLPERQRLVVEMVELDGLTAAEAGEALGIAPATARWHLHQARRALRTALAPLRSDVSSAGGTPGDSGGDR